MSSLPGHANLQTSIRRVVSTLQHFLIKSYFIGASGLFCVLSVIGMGNALAQCPFAISGVATNPSLPSDGLLFIRAALQLTGPSLTAGTSTALNDTQITAAITSNSARLDINGSGGFDINDASIIARYLAGFRDSALIPNGAGAGATRTLASEIQVYIANGCPAPTPTRSGEISYFFNNNLFGVDATTLVSQLRLTDNNFDLKYVGHDLGPNKALVVGYNVDTVGNNAEIYIYRADGSEEARYAYPTRFTSPPLFSPDGQTFGVNIENQSGQLGVPSTFRTAFFSRATGDSIVIFDGTLPFGWLPDGRPVIKLPQGLVIFPSLLSTTSGTLIANTADALNFSVSPDGNRIVFIARASSAAPRRVHMVNTDGTSRRQVTTAQIGEEVQAVFSPNGSELLIKSDECGIIFSSARLVQLIPADATLLNVTNSTTPYRLLINGTQRVCADASVSWR